MSSFGSGFTNTITKHVHKNCFRCIRFRGLAVFDEHAVHVFAPNVFMNLDD